MGNVTVRIDSMQEAIAQKLHGIAMVSLNEQAAMIQRAAKVATADSKKSRDLLRRCDNRLCGIVDDSLLADIQAHLGEEV